MGAFELVSGELRAGLPRLEGTRLSLVVPLRQSVIDEVLPLLPGLPPGVSVVFGADQHGEGRSTAPSMRPLASVLTSICGRLRC